VTTLELPTNAQVERIPSNVQFQSGPLSYTASYLLEGLASKPPCKAGIFHSPALTGGMHQSQH
jgi:hypothetical protein